MKDKAILQGIGFAVLATLIWSGNFIIARAVINDIPPIGLSFYRWLTATLIVLPFALRVFKTEWKTVKAHLPYFFLVSVTGVSLFNTFVYIGGHHTSAINLALIGTTSSPIIANILAAIFLGERIGWLKITGMLICVAGILFLLAKGDPANLLHLQFSEGDAWVLLAGLSFAIYNTFVKKKPAAVSSLNFLFTTFVFGTLMLFPAFIIEGRNAAPISWTPGMGGVILYLGLGASVICFFLWNKSIQALGAGRAALFGNLIPVFSSIEAVIWLKEPFTIYHIISMVLVFAGLLIANLTLFSRKPGNPATPE